MYIFRAVLPPPPQRKFARCKIHFASKSCVLLYWQRHCTALYDRDFSFSCCCFKHMYSKGRPSRDTSVPRLLVIVVFTATVTAGKCITVVESLLVCRACVEVNVNWMLIKLHRRTSSINHNSWQGRQTAGVGLYEAPPQPHTAEWGARWRPFDVL